MASSMAIFNEAQADLAVNLLRETSLANPSASAIISPVAIAIALSMVGDQVYVGAERETKSELRELLAGRVSNGASLVAHYGQIVDYLSAEHKNYSLESANRVYVDNRLKVLEGFRDSITRFFRGNFVQLDISHPRMAANAINRFVDEITRHKIKEIVSPQDITADSRLFLVNALHFKANWAKQFEQRQTRKVTFYNARGQERQVDMMRQRSFFTYYEDFQAQILGLPYEGGEVSMFIILPKQRHGLKQLLESIDGKKILEYISKVEKKFVDLSLPRFQVESSFELSRSLRKLGLRTLFADADLSGIAGQESLRVNEQVSEAAAATVVQVSVKSGRPPASVEFKANHPFAYVIADNVQHNVLFFGHVSSFS
ncbi:SRPN-1 protein [Aphelenchoides avenae]|nr:SRPN-1 protein [Aphelenchus avenae]